MGQGTDIAGPRDLGVTLNTGEGGRKGGAPHVGAGARKDPPLCSTCWVLTTCFLESGAGGTVGSGRVTLQGGCSAGSLPGAGKCPASLQGFMRSLVSLLGSWQGRGAGLFRRRGLSVGCRDGVPPDKRASANPRLEPHRHPEEPGKKRKEEPAPTSSPCSISHRSRSLKRSVSCPRGFGRLLGCTESL